MINDNNLGLSDEALAKEVQTGNTAVFGVLMERYQAKLLRYAKRFLSRTEDGEDVIQEVFIKTFRNIKSFDTTRKFSPWIYRIAHNELVNGYKRQLRDFLDFFDFDTFFPQPVAKENVEERLDNEQARTVIESCLDKIDPKYREPLVLYYLEEMDYKEIAEVMRLPVSTVGVRISRGKAKLKQVCQQLRTDKKI